MKRILTMIVISAVLLSCIGIACASDTNDTAMEMTNDTQEIISDGETVFAQQHGARNITFSDGYNGYCINMSKHEADVGNEFTPKDTSHAMNNKYNTPIGNYLKILFVDYYDFAIKDSDATSEVVWDFSDRYYLDSTNEITQAILKDAENGRTIPDHGAVKKINSTTEAVFDFEVFDPFNDDLQNYIGYKITFRAIQNTTNTTENITNETNNITNQTNQTEKSENKSDDTQATNATNKKDTNKTTTSNKKDITSNDTKNSTKTSTNNTNNHNITITEHATGNPVLLLLIGCIIAIFRREK